MATIRTLIGNIKGPKGETGSQGPQGEQGPGATINVGTVSTTEYGNPVQITNSGTETDAVLDFVIPQGKPGEATTKMSDLTLDTITTQTTEYPIPAVGDIGSTAWGKVVKFFNDVKTALTNVLNKTDVVNDLNHSDTDKPLSAAMGKQLNDALANKANITDLAGEVRIFSGNLHNGWSTNGDCFYRKVGGFVHIHLSIRNGTQTDGTEILSGLAPTWATLGPISNRNTGKCGYYQVDTQGYLRIYGVDSANIMMDVFYR